MLHELYQISEANNLGVGVAVKLKFAIISAIFDYNPKISDAMKPEHWEKLLQCISELLSLLNSRSDIVMGEHVLVTKRIFPEDKFHSNAIYIRRMTRGSTNRK